MMANRTSEDKYFQNSVSVQTERIYENYQQRIYRETDRMFAVLMCLQWLGSIAAALFFSPLTWIGQTSQVHIHVWAAVFLGGAITLLPVAMAIIYPGRALTRYSIAIGQMLMSSLLIHLTGGRIETHFHVFGSLAFLSAYRDWRVLIPASAIVAADHCFRGIYYPQSVFGVMNVESWRWVEHAAWVVFEDIFLVISCLRSQQEMKQIARNTAELDASEERYRSVIEDANDIIFRTNAAGEFTFVNTVVTKLLGYQPEEIVGQHFTRLIAPEDQKRVAAFYVKQFANAEPYGFCEFTVKAKDGTDRLVQQNVQPIIENNRIVGSQAIVRDVTERKRAEDAIRKSEEYQNLFRNANDAILILDPETEVVLDVNDRACKTYDLTREEFIGRCLKSMSIDIERGERQLHKLITEGSFEQFETIQLRSDGSPIHLLVNSSLIELDGKPAILSINRDITDRKRIEQQLVHNAFHDALTGLPNRALFLEHLGKTINRSERDFSKLFAVLFLDFDRFKIVNDSLGHMEGDKLLVMIARRLEACLRPGDVVARLGGDEFTILLDELSDPEDVEQIIERIQNEMKTPFQLTGREVFTSASIGVTFSNAAYTKPEEMLRDADIAMYRAKATGKARHQIFTKKMHEQASTRLQTETELRLAVERREFRVYYQPIVELKNNKLVGFESLLRWEHPEKGIVPPLDFIPLAEETGLILPIGEWVLKESCRQARAWQIEYPALADLAISVNLSAVQFVQTDLAERVAGILRETGLKPNHLKLEITESHVMEDSQSAISIMNKLRELGVKLSIDDFGTGYSSLSYLYRMPINYLKIDRSFINRMRSNRENNEIVRTIIMLAQNLGIEVIAEGIETSEQADHLKDLQCHFGQGYLFAKPQTAEQALELINSFSHLESPAAKDKDISDEKTFNLKFAGEPKFQLNNV